MRVIHMARNGGFAYGCNRGWRAGGSELVLFLNPDARLESAALARLAHVLDRDPVAGVVGPRTHDRGRDARLVDPPISLAALDVRSGPLPPPSGSPGGMGGRGRPRPGAV